MYVVLENDVIYPASFVNELITVGIRASALAFVKYKLLPSDTSSVSSEPVPVDTALSTYALVVACSAADGAPLNVSAPVNVPPANGSLAAIAVVVVAA